MPLRPTPGRELTLMPRPGFPWPRLATPPHRRCRPRGPGDGGGDERARQAVKLRHRGLVGRTLGEQRAVGQLEVDAGGKPLPHLTLRPLNLDGVADHLDGDAFGNRDRFFANSRHSLDPLGFGLWSLDLGPGLTEPKAQSLEPKAYQMLHNTSPPTPAFTAAR